MPYRVNTPICAQRCAFAAGSGRLQHIGDGLARGLDGLYRGLADGDDGHEGLAGGNAEDRLDLGGAAPSMKRLRVTYFFSMETLYHVPAIRCRRPERFSVVMVKYKP